MSVNDRLQNLAIVDKHLVDDGGDSSSLATNNISSLNVDDNSVVGRFFLLNEHFYDCYTASLVCVAGSLPCRRLCEYGIIVSRKRRCQYQKIEVDDKEFLQN